jgi:hypothetical protein
MALVLTGLALSGICLGNKQTKEKSNIEEIPINKHEDIEKRNQYNSRRLKKVYRDIDNKASVMNDKSLNPQEYNVINQNYNKLIQPQKDTINKRIKDIQQSNYSEIDNDDNIFGDHTKLFENSNQLINDKHYQKYINKTKKEQSFLDQFNEGKFDNKGPAMAENSLDIDLERGLKEGFSVINEKDTKKDLTYGVVNNKDFVHNNMVPHFSSKSYGDFNDSWDHTKQIKVDLFTGSSREYVKKKERAPLFNPFKNLTHVYGMPSTTDYRQSRYYGSLGRERRNELLLQPQRVAPGVNQGYNAYGIDGFHPSYRALPKSVDELRTANRPKVSYTAPVKPAFKRTSRAMQAPVVKYRPERYRDELQRNMVKNLGNIRAPKVRDNYFIKETNKETTLKEHYGVAGNSEQSVGKNVPISLVPKVRKTNRQVYRHPGISNLSNESRFDEKYLNTLQKSYFFPENQRSKTQYNQHLLAPKRNQGQIAYDKDLYRAKNTIKETTEHQQHISNAARNQGQVAYNPNSIARNTIKQTTQHNQHITNAGRNKGQIAYNKELYRAKNTIKETTEHQQHITNASRNKGQIAYDKDFYRAKNTIKELTEHNQHITNTGQNRGHVVYDPNDVARNTIKETTEHNQHITNTGRNRGQIVYDKDLYRAKNTIKETTEHNQHITNTGRNRGQIAYDKDLYRAKNTIKELTEHNQHITNTGRNRGQVVYDPNDIPGTTTKELTENNQHILGANRQRGHVAYDKDDWKARGTARETTQNTYYVPAGFSYDHEAPRVYDAEYNAQIDTCKEELALSGRPPTLSNYPKGPIPDNTVYKLKEINYPDREEVPDCRYLNALFRMPVNLTKSRMTVPQEERRLDEQVLSGLDTCPFAIPSYYNNCDKTALLK